MTAQPQPLSTRPWRNWAGTEEVTPRRVLAPATSEEVAEAVRGAAAEDLPVRMVGSGHSFTGAAVAPGVQLRPDRLTAVHEIDSSSGLVTVDAGIPLHQFLKPYRAVPDPTIRRNKHQFGCFYVDYSCSRTHRQIMGLVRALLSSEAAIPG